MSTPLKGRSDSSEKRVYLSRREVFSASHVLTSSRLNEMENMQLFGKCNHPSGHGHNYELVVTLCGPIDPKTGLVFNLSDLKEIIHKEVLSKVDHRHLNLDVPEFKNLNPTAENIAAVIWNWLEPHFPKGILYEVRVHETENNVAWIRSC